MVEQISFKGITKEAKIISCPKELEPEEIGNAVLEETHVDITSLHLLREVQLEGQVPWLTPCGL